MEKKGSCPQHLQSRGQWLLLRVGSTGAAPTRFQVTEPMSLSRAGDAPQRTLGLGPSPAVG